MSLRERASAYVEDDQVESLVSSVRARLAELHGQSGKTCSMCGEKKPLSAFAVRSSEPDGLYRECRTCFNGARTRRRQAQR